MTNKHPVLSLIGLNHKQSGKTYRVDRTLVAGRLTTCDIVLFDGVASRKQAQISLGPEGAAFIADLDSSNGTFVNDKKISTTRLIPGDVVRMGQTKFAVQRANVDASVEVIDLPKRDKAKMVKVASTVRAPNLTRLLEEFIAAGAAAKCDAHHQVEQLQRKTRNLTTLFEISQISEHVTEAATLLPQARATLLKAPGGHHAHPVFVDEQGQLVPGYPGCQRKTPLWHFNAQQNRFNYVLQEKCGVLAQDLQSDQRFAGSKSILFGEPAQFWPPILQGQSAAGLIALCSDSEHGTPVEDDLDLLCVAANMIGAALENITLRNELEETQKEVLFTMGAIGETRRKKRAITSSAWPSIRNCSRCCTA